MTADAPAKARPRKNISFWVTDEQKAVLDEYRKMRRMGQTTLVDDAVREYLAARGVEWPPAPRLV